MRYRKLGRTGLEVSVVGFGGSPLGGVFGEVDASECVRTVHAAIDAGITQFTRAPVTCGAIGTGTGTGTAGASSSCMSTPSMG